MFPSANEFRRRARECLGSGIFKDGWVYAVLVVAVIGVIESLISATVVGSIVIAGILSTALANYFLGRVRGTVRYDDFGSLIEGAKKDLGGEFLLGILEVVFVILWSLLFLIPGIIKAVGYSMAYYIKCDYPGMSAMDALKESERMMKGYKWKYFCLQFSFIGWIIVGALCLGVGVFWAATYANTASAMFYEELKSARAGEFYVGPDSYNPSENA